MKGVITAVINNCPQPYKQNTLEMNFFDGFSSSPTYPKPALSHFPPPPAGFLPQSKKNNLASDQLSHKSGRSNKKYDADDILDMFPGPSTTKVPEKKDTRKKDIQPFSSTQLQIPSSLNSFNNNNDTKRIDSKWSTTNIDLGLGMGGNVANPSPRFPGKRINTNQDKSEDGRSFKSGFTTNNRQNFDLDNLMTTKLPEQKEEISFERSTRGGMRPPLNRKQKQQKQKEPSVLNDDISIKFSRGIPESATNIDLFPNSSKNNIKNAVPPVAPSAEPKERIIEREKVITVREEAKELKTQFDTQLAQIKKSYQRQLKEVKTRLQEQTQQSQKSKTKLIQEYEAKMDEERRKWRKVADQNQKRMKEMHQWELKKKEEGYQLQIEKVKAMSRIEGSIQDKQDRIGANNESIQLKMKEKQIQFQRKKLDDMRRQLDERAKNLQFEQDNFSRYRQREEMKLQQERRTLMEDQNKFKMRQLEEKRVLAEEKQNLARELAASELDIVRRKEGLDLEKEELRVGRELFEREKGQFQQFNKNLVVDYKEKLKDIEEQRDKINQLQIQLYKKIHTVEVVSNQRDKTKAGQTPLHNHSPAAKTGGFHRPQSNQENMRNRVNSTSANIGEIVGQTKSRFRELQMQAKRGAVEVEEERYRGRDRVNVSGYIARMNRAMSRH